VAHYEYDPFGNTIAQSGTLADENPFRFSTKYHDDETALYYYGLRYYSPDLGRWLSRDPIGESGGVNVYGFVNNTSPSSIDILGLVLRLAFFGAGPHGSGSSGAITIGNHYLNQIATATAVSAEKFSWAEGDLALRLVVRDTDVHPRDGKITQREVDMQRPIKIVAYSWGVPTAVKLTRKLNRPGATYHGVKLCVPVRIDALLVLDPVRRWWVIGGVVVEDNVDFFGNWYQRKPGWGVNRTILRDPTGAVAPYIGGDRFDGHRFSDSRIHARSKTQIDLHNHPHYRDHSISLVYLGTARTLIGKETGHDFVPRFVRDRIISYMR
jgi:RHS repeat-associated protein